MRRVARVATPTVTRPIVTAMLIASCCVLLAACSTYSQSPADYLPKFVGKQAVQADDEFAGSIVSSLKGPDASDVVAGSIGGGGQGAQAIPGTVLVAARTTKPIDSASSIEKIVGVRKDIGVSKERIGGVPVDFAEVKGEFSDQGISVALAAPQPKVQLIVVVFRGGKKAAQQGIEAMLQAGRK